MPLLRHPWLHAAALALSLGSGAELALAQQLTPASVNEAEFSGRGELQGAALVKLQVLLDRAHVSPGQIDGKAGENTRKAVKAYQQRLGRKADGRVDAELWHRLAADAEPVLTTYRISDADVAGPFIERVPEDYRDKAALPALAFTGPLELLAEKFHMSEALLEALNPEAAFDRAGTELIVAHVRQNGLDEQITRVEVDGRDQVVTAYGRGRRVLAVYPATVGSSERPSPAGKFEVTAIAKDPVYYYDPKNQLRGVKVEEQLKLPPGPNNPVGTVWIDLSSKGYGIHGTPEPDKVSKSASHGCVRLTNWDANELAAGLRRGTPVRIVAGKKRSD